MMNMITETENNASQPSTFRFQSEQINGFYPIDAAGLMNYGISLSKNGQCAEAKKVFLQVTKAEPQNEDAWLWLASISEYPEELLGFAGKVLAINPHNQRALEWLNANKVLMAKTLTERGATAVSRLKKDSALYYFRQAVEYDAENDSAWLWLARLSGDTEEKTCYLNRVLRINGKNEHALELLGEIRRTEAEEILRKATSAAFSGRRDEAEKILQDVFRYSEEFEDAWLLEAYLTEDLYKKMTCYEKVLAINPQNEAARSGLLSLQAFMPKNSDKIYSEESNQLAAEDENREELTERRNDVTDYAQSASDTANAEINPADKQNFDDFEQGEFSAFSNASSEENSDETASLQPVSFESEHQFAEAKTDETGESEFGENALLDTEDFSAEINTADYFFDNYLHSPAVENDYAENAPDVQEISAQTDTLPEYFAEDTAETSEQTNRDGGETSELQAIAEDSGAVDASTVRYSEEKPLQVADCPFCGSENGTQNISCKSCYAVLSLADLEMFFFENGTNRSITEAAVERLEQTKAQRPLSLNELFDLAIGCLNNKKFRQGIAVLQEAFARNTNDLVLESKINFLAIRLNEIESQIEKENESAGYSRKILVVDDSPTVRKLIAAKLEKCGHSVISAVDGMDALAKISEVTPDLILLDITMPRMDGYQVCKMIRGNETTKDIPVVMISGKDGFFDKVRGKMAGSTGYITKPFGPDALVKAVEIYAA